MSNFKPNHSGITRVIKAAGFAVQGVRAVYQSEAAFRQECLLLLVALPFSFWLADNIIEWILLIGSLLLVLVVELLNSAIEAVVDRFGSVYHPLSGKAKDAGAAAVLLTLILATLVWLVILLC